MVSSWLGGSWFGSSWYGSSWFGTEATPASPGADAWFPGTWFGQSWFGSSWYGGGTSQAPAGLRVAWTGALGGAPLGLLPFAGDSRIRAGRGSAIMGLSGLIDQSCDPVDFTDAAGAFAALATVLIPINVAADVLFTGAQYIKPDCVEGVAGTAVMELSGSLTGAVRASAKGTATMGLSGVIVDATAIVASSGVAVMGLSGRLAGAVRGGAPGTAAMGLSGTMVGSLRFLNRAGPSRTYVLPAESRTAYLEPDDRITTLPNTS